MITLKPSQLFRFLQEAIRYHEPVLVQGPPGVGKTQIITQAATASDNNMLQNFPAVEDPTEPGGFPWIAPDYSHAKKVPFGNAYAAIHSQKPTVWCWDDFGQGSAMTQSGYMQWSLARQMNGDKLPDHVTIIGATNRRSDRANVSGILEPVKGRFTIVELTTDVDDVCQLFLQRNRALETVAFLRFRPNLLHDFTPTADIANSPNPRNWEAVANWTERHLDADLEAAAYVGRVGVGAGAEYTAFLKIYRDLPNIDALILDPEKAPIPQEPASLFAVATATASKVNVKNVSRVFRYAERLQEKGHAEFGVLLIRDSYRKDPAISSTPAYTKMMLSPLGKMILGN